MDTFLMKGRKIEDDLVTESNINKSTNEPIPSASVVEIVGLRKDVVGLLEQSISTKIVI